MSPRHRPSRAYLELMAEALGLALANQRLRSALLEKALFDSLTGLRNRHHLDDALHTQINLAVQNHAPLSCLMIDIDHFKTINDRYGHEAGDLVIKSVAVIVQRAVRDKGMAFRYGGEEFLVLLAGANEETARACAEEIYDSVRSLTLRDGLTEIGGGCLNRHCQFPAAYPERQSAASRGCRTLPGQRAGALPDSQFRHAEIRLNAIRG